MESRELVRQSRSGDATALPQLIERHLPGLRAFARVRMSPLLRAHESGSDVVQSACAEVLGKLDTFEFRSEAAFRAWLYKAVLNTLRDKEKALRAGKRDGRRQVPLPSAGDAEPLAQCYSQVLTPSRHVIAAERVRALEAAFDELPDHYREVIALSRIARLSRAEIAAELGRTEASVRNLISRGLAMLADALRRHDDASRS